MMSEITRPERVLYYLLPRRLANICERGTDWGWGVVVNLMKKSPATSETTPHGGAYIVDTLLLSPLIQVGMVLGLNHARLVLGKRVKCIFKVRLSIPPDLRPVDSRQSILLAVQELERRFPQGLPKLKGDMGIEEKDIVELVSQIEELEQKLLSHPAHKSQDVHHVKCFQRKAKVNHEIQQLKSKMRESQFRHELTNQSRVLKKLGHINADVVQLKGRATALIDTGDELLVTELMFNGSALFSELARFQIETAIY
ncbi:DExH-box ATP-dependent RNA helicase DExH10 [Bienertia sinuspersici]